MHIHPLEPSDWDAFGPLLSHCFGIPIAAWDLYRRRIGDENFRGAWIDGGLAGGLGVYPIAQWFGGRSVPTGGVAVVGVAPEHRADGVAAALVTASLRELRDRGVPLATLYASTQHVYRSVGFEQAGNQVRYSVPLASIGKQDRALRAVRVEGWEPLAALRRPRHGFLDRRHMLWERIVAPYDVTTHAYAFGDEGYLVYSQERAGDAHARLFVRDWCAHTPAAARRLWSFLADHRSLASEVRWNGPAVEPMLALLPEATWKVERHERWLMRIVDVPAALRARGWPADGEVHLEVRDAVLPDNEGRWILRVEAGEAEVTRGGRGDVRLDVRGLAPLYSGLFDAAALRDLGWLEAADVGPVTRLFASPEPWMADMF